jgi:hypothetical protein
MVLVSMLVCLCGLVFPGTALADDQQHHRAAAGHLHHIRDLVEKGLHAVDEVKDVVESFHKAANELGQVGNAKGKEAHKAVREATERAEEMYAEHKKTGKHKPEHHDVIKKLVGHALDLLGL